MTGIKSYKIRQVMKTHTQPIQEPKCYDKNQGKKTVVHKKVRQGCSITP